MNGLGVPEIQFVERKTLPSRRRGSIIVVSHLHAWGKRDYTVGYGFDENNDVREIFCWPEKTGADLDAIISDACIGISHALQRGAKVSEFATAFGQLRPEGAPDGEYPPSSALGSIMRVGVLVEALEKRKS